MQCTGTATGSGSSNGANEAAKTQLAEDDDDSAGRGRGSAQLARTGAARQGRVQVGRSAGDAWHRPAAAAAHGRRDGAQGRRDHRSRSGLRGEHGCFPGQPPDGARQRGRGQLEPHSGRSGGDRERTRVGWLCHQGRIPGFGFLAVHVNV